MVLLVDETTERAAAQSSGLAPYEGPDPGLLANLKANASATMEYWNLNSAYRNRVEAHREFQVEFYRESGQYLPDWVNTSYADAFDTARKQFEGWKTQHPDSKLTFPTGEEFQKRADDIGLSFKNRADDVSRRSTSWSSSIGAFLGSAAGTTTDPFNLLTMGFGAGPSQSILRAALIEGGINLASEAAVQTGTFERHSRLDPNFKISDAVGQVVAAGLGGAVLGGGAKALARAWSGVADRVWPSSIRDAARVVERDAVMPDSPFPGSVARDAAHDASFSKAYDDLSSGRPIDLSTINPAVPRGVEIPAAGIAPARAVGLDAAPSIARDQPNEIRTLPTSDEIRRMSSAPAAVFDDMTIVETLRASPDRAMPPLAKAIDDVTGEWLDMRAAVARGDLPEGADISRNVAEAAQIIQQARAAGQDVREIIATPEMHGGLNETTKLVARAMFSDPEMTKPVNRKQFATFLKSYAGEMVKPPAPARRVAAAARPLVDQARALPLPERTAPELQKIAEAPELVDTQVHFAEHLTANQPDLTIDLGDGLGERRLVDLLDEARSEIAAGREIEACVIGRDMD